uniref:PA domain-containing protein n=1 Tax=Pseudonaja textilis TaxID=8673 RepID=A0A670ZPM7_PSETE
TPPLSLHLPSVVSGEAWFGPPVPVTGLKGYLLETVPANACHPIKAAPVSNRTPSGFVALIRRYDCSFNLKVFHAQEAGYRAAIIYNLCSDFLVNMAISMEERRLPIVIPSMFIGRTTSRILKHLRRRWLKKKREIALIILVIINTPCDVHQDITEKVFI